MRDDSSNAAQSRDQLSEIRRLWAERAAKEREIANIDMAISLAVGLTASDRPRRERLSKNDFRSLCGASSERVSKK